jgi:hypothetical protein
VPIVGPSAYMLDAKHSKASDDVLHPSGGAIPPVATALLIASTVGQIAGVGLIGVGEILCAGARAGCSPPSPSHGAWRFYPTASTSTLGIGVGYDRW